MKPSITLAIDSLAPQLTGIGRYCWELCNRLATSDQIRKVQFYRDHGVVKNPSLYLHSTAPAQQWLQRMRWLRNLQSHSLKRNLSHTLFHSPNFFLPQTVEQGIITVHDLSVFKYPETHPAKRILEFERNFNRSLSQASHIITDSYTLRDEIVAFTGVPPENISVTYMGVAAAYRHYSEAEIEQTLRENGLTYQRYALCVSTLEPRKRVHTLLKAWKLLPQALRTRFPLVLVGARGWANDVLMQDIASAQAEGWLHLLGYISETDLPKIYAGSGLFLYPSIYEGFGLPPIEAMACHIPTIVANASCLPEVTQGAAMLVEPDDTADFARRIEQALTDEDWRFQAVQQGALVAKSYSWSRCADATISIYRQHWNTRRGESIDVLPTASDRLAPFR